VDVLAWGIGFSFGLIAGDLYYQASGAEESATISIGFPIAFSVLWLIASKFITKHLSATVKATKGHWIAAFCTVVSYVLLSLLFIALYVAVRG